MSKKGGGRGRNCAERINVASLGQDLRRGKRTGSGSFENLSSRTRELSVPSERQSANAANKKAKVFTLASFRFPHWRPGCRLPAREGTDARQGAVDTAGVRRSGRYDPQSVSGPGSRWTR